MANYLVYDVFTEHPFGGNQLAVFPDARSLPEADLCRITREFNFSEVTFVYPPRDPSHTARVRIFTPNHEVPFAGHPTIGTAIALSEAGAGEHLVLELGIGPVSCRVDHGSASFTNDMPLCVLAQPLPGEVAQAVSLHPDQIVTAIHPPTQAGVGLNFTLTELTDRNALSQAAPNIEGFKAAHSKYPGSLDFAQFLYVRDRGTIHARMFAPLDDVPEDPATGSACAALGALLRQLHQQDQEFTVHQGDDMGRPSRIGVKAHKASVTITGHAVCTMRGELAYL